MLYIQMVTKLLIAIDQSIFMEVEADCQVFQLKGSNWDLYCETTTGKALYSLLNLHNLS